MRFLVFPPDLVGSFTTTLDCGIRPATSAEAEWLQDYIHKSNNNAAQQSVNAARLAHEQADAVHKNEDRSDDDEDEDSEGLNSTVGSKRNSMALSAEMKAPIFTPDLSDKTPTAATLLSQVQSAPRPPSSFPPQASIRRHVQGDPSLTVSSHSPQPANSTTYLGSQPPLSVRHFPHFPSIDDAVGSSSTHHTILAREVWGWFQDHLDSLLESVRLFRFDQFEMRLRSFWTNLNGQHREIVHAPSIAGLMAKADAIVYDVGSIFLVWSGHLNMWSFSRKSSRPCAHKCCLLCRRHRYPVSDNWQTRWKRFCLSPSKTTVTLLSSRRWNSVLDLDTLFVGFSPPFCC